MHRGCCRFCWRPDHRGDGLHRPPSSRTASTVGRFPRLGTGHRQVATRPHPVDRPQRIVAETFDRDDGDFGRDDRCDLAVLFPHRETEGTTTPYGLTSSSGSGLDRSSATTSRAGVLTIRKTVTSKSVSPSDGQSKSSGRSRSGRCLVISTEVVSGPVGRN